MKRYVFCKEEFQIIYTDRCSVFKEVEQTLYTLSVECAQHIPCKKHNMERGKRES
jgi:hypothetical protein